MGERLKGKVAIVSGAGARAPGMGNGKAVAILFAREGAKVLAADINLEAAEETRSLVEKEGGTCVTIKTDVSKSADCRAMVEKCVETFGRVDILHNNVGIPAFGGVVDTSEEDWDRTMAVNLKGMFLTCKYAIPYMEKQGSGSITNISSIAAYVVQPTALIAYSVTKAGIIALTREIAVQYAGKGIRANSILPGMMKTAATQSAQSSALRIIFAASNQDAASMEAEKLEAKRSALAPLGKQGDPWDTAYAALFLNSDEAKYITGTTLVVDGGITGVMRGWEPPKSA